MHIEPYLMVQTNRQANDLAELVNRKAVKQYLKEVRPDKFERYETVEKAAKTITAVVVRGNVMAHIMYDDDAIVAGIGTVIRSMTVARSKDSGFRLSGRQIDYFADPAYGAGFHAAAAVSLAGNGGYNGPVIATLTSAETAWAPGIPAMMTRTGEPGRLVEDGTDFGLSGIAEPLQAYFTYIGALKLPAATGNS